MVTVVAPDGLIAERYRLLHPLGSGASATVWAAADETLGRQVALKVLSGPAAIDLGEREQLRREARALAALAHPHIIVVFDFLETPGLDGTVQPVLITELLDGVSLAARLVEGPLDWPEALSVCGQLADALTAAHRAGIVHRDVTPANVMLTDLGAKLLDFGIAQAALEEGTVDGQTVGTPVCMAPEQLAGDGALPASDVYALGCVLHWCLTGQPPYRDRDVTWLSHAHLHAAPPPLEVQGLPRDISAFYLACLSKDPAQRPTAAQAAETLAPYIAKPVRETAPVPTLADEVLQDGNTTQMLPLFDVSDPEPADTDAPDAATTAAASTPRSAGRHAGVSSGIDRRRLLPIGLLLAALVAIVLLILGLAHATSGGGTSTAQSTATSSSTGTGTATASATSGVDVVTLPSTSAAASAASPSRSATTTGIPSLPNPAGNLIGYVQALSGQVQALIAQGPETLRASAGQDLISSLGDLQHAIAAAQDNGGKRQWRTVDNTISDIERQISGDASAGRISASAANLLNGELRRLFASLPGNGG